MLHNASSYLVSSNVFDLALKKTAHKLEEELHFISWATTVSIVAVMSVYTLGKCGETSENVGADLLEKDLAFSGWYRDDHIVKLSEEQ